MGRLRQPIQNVPRDPLDGWILALQPAYPLGAACRHHSAAARVAAEHRGARLRVLFLLVPQRVLDPANRIVALAEAGRAGAEDREVLGCTILVGRHRQTVLEHKVAAVALVADDLGFAPEQGAALQLGAREDPMIRAVDRVSAGTVLEQFKETMVAAPGPTDAGHLVLGPADQPMAPHAAEQ